MELRSEIHFYMYNDLLKSPLGEPVYIRKIINARVSDVFSDLGLEEGTEIIRLGEPVELQPLWVEGVLGNAVLSPSMTISIIVEQEKGKIRSACELKSGEKGVIKALINTEEVLGIFQVLGIKLGDVLKVKKTLPNACFLAALNKNKIFRFDFDSAARIWGVADGHNIQFARTIVNKPFRVIDTFFQKTNNKPKNLPKVESGNVFVLKRIENIDHTFEYKKSPVLIQTKSGLRLLVPFQTAKQIYRAMPSVLVMWQMCGPIIAEI